MRKYFLSMLTLISFALGFIASVEEDDELSHGSGSGTENPQDNPGSGKIRVKGTLTINGLPVTEDGIIVNSFFDDASPTNGQFEVEAYSNNLPQLLFVTNAEEKIILLARNCFAANESIVLNEESTALALISLYPLFINADKDNFDDLAEILQQSSQYPAYLDKVKSIIQSGGEIFNADNSDLLVAMNNVIEDICQENRPQTASMPSLFARASTVEGITSDPFDVTTAGNSVIICNQGLVPTYECQVYYGGRMIESKLIEARSSYGFMDLFQRTVGNAHLGEPAEFVLANEGEYRFYFDRTTERAITDFSRRLWADALTIIGIDSESNLISTSTAIIRDIAQLLMDPTTEFTNVLATVSGHLLQLGTSMKWSDAAKILNKINLIYNAIKGTGNEAARIIMGFRTPYFVDFCLCQYNNNITTCTKSDIEKVSGDNQVGFPREKLLLPLVVSTKVYADDGSEIERSTYQKVKFEVISGGGSVDKEYVGTEIDSKTASTYWTVGNQGEQVVKAVVVDMVTGVEVSDPVYFTATLREETDLTIRLDWNKLSGNTDIDLHVTDPFGEEIAYYHMRSASGGWLDRDDVVGPGPEHISWTDAPAGQYLIQVHYYGSETQAVTSYKVTINALGTTYGPYTGSIAYHQLITIGTLDLPSGIMNRAPANESIPMFLEKREVMDNYICPFTK